MIYATAWYDIESDRFYVSDGDADYPVFDSGKGHLHYDELKNAEINGKLCRFVQKLGLAVSYAGVVSCTDVVNDHEIKQTQ